jgi:hypothetical protein
MYHLPPYVYCSNVGRVIRPFNKMGALAPTYSGRGYYGEDDKSRL